ncbi:hypothetical protein PCASD_03997 [Puccinia coronata f. sp. avenae]|uniref:Uncharacterized protein n=1 Tax=Puccinia coronata f. sp. avenae TaxID=200324 RepID=A0A2N5V5J4_9BASI|nr:hypothetical protein PCASD_03997 [Puccinia coronata f. sp. avenae]
MVRDSCGGAERFLAWEICSTLALLALTSQTGTVQPKHLPAGRTGLSNQFLGPVAQDQPGPVAQDQPGPVAQDQPGPVAQDQPGPVAQDQPGPVAQDQPGPVAQDQPGPVGQICPTSWLSLRSDSARPTTGRTRLFEHRSNCRV